MQLKYRKKTSITNSIAQAIYCPHCPLKICTLMLRQSDVRSYSNIRRGWDATQISEEDLHHHGSIAQAIYCAHCGYYYISQINFEYGLCSTMWTLMFSTFKVTLCSLFFFFLKSLYCIYLILCKTFTHMRPVAIIDKRIFG